MSDTTTTPSDLLQQLDWMRALARDLVSDPDQAEDLTQDTLVAGLQHPPRGTEGLRSWIATVMRNRFREGLRLRENRLAREVANAREELECDAAELAERAQTQRQVSKFLLELEEPYRATLLMRFYGDHPPRVIAARMGVPVATVKSRLHRGLAQLREQLDRSFPDRRSWMLALVPWAREAPVPTTALAAGTLMSVKLILAGCLALIVGLWWLGSGSPGASVVSSGQQESPAREDKQESTVGEDMELATGLRSRVETVPELESSLIPTGAILRIERSIGSLRGMVMDAEAGTPLANATLNLRPAVGGLPMGFEFEDERTGGARVTRSGSSGEFEFEALEEGPYELDVSDDRGRSRRELVAATTEGHAVQVWLGRGESRNSARDIYLIVRDETGRPVRGASVTLRGQGRHQSLRDSGELERYTDQDGLALFERVELERGVFLAEDELGRRARLNVSSRRSWQQRLRGLAVGDGRILQGRELVLCDPGSVEIAVQGAPIEGLELLARSWDRPEYAATSVPFEATELENGHWGVGGLAPGTYDLKVRARDGLRLLVGHREAESVYASSGRPEQRFRSYAPRRVEVKAGETSRLSLKVVEGPILRGRVSLAADGSPVPGARVLATLPQGLTSDPDRVRRRGVHLWRLDVEKSLGDRDPTTTAVTTTDEEGRYSFGNLQPGPHWRIEVHAPGLSYERRQDVPAFDGDVVELEHVLVPAGGLQGVAQSLSTLGLRPVGEEDFVASFTVPDRPLAPFTLPGLIPGTYEVHVLSSKESSPPLMLATVEVRAGELTWVDLMAASPQVVEGRILHRGQPVVGAVLDFFGPQATTDSDGRFRWHYPHRFAGARGFNLICSSIPDSTTLRVDYQGMCSGYEQWPQALHLPDGSIELTVLNEDGQPLSTWVELAVHTQYDEQRLGSGLRIGKFLDKPEPPAEEHYTIKTLGAWSRQSRARRRTDARGRVRFATLPEGRYRLRCVGESSLHVAPVTVDLDPGATLECEARPSPAGELRLRLANSEGEPIVGESVHLVFAGDEYPVLRTTDDQGFISVEHAPLGTTRAYYPTHGSISGKQIEFEVSEDSEEVVELVYDWKARGY